MDLKKITENLYLDSKSTPIRGLSAIAEAENYLLQAYEGRYLFELIQNVRDANKEINQRGEISIEHQNGILSISNSGAEFSKGGIESITTIGRSTKSSQDFIGFKGIGFKAIQEVSFTPCIITRYGTVLFDRNLTLKDYNSEKLKLEEIPLFYFPHFLPTKLNGQDNNFVTRIDLPLKKKIKEEDIFQSFKSIQPKQIVLLGNLEKITFKSENHFIEYKIFESTNLNRLEIQTNTDEIYQFKKFEPKNKVLLPSNIISKLEGKEKELYSESSSIDISIVFQLNENSQISPLEDAKLYLFYPLQIASGFRFIIHSYFIVNPERTALRNSPLNEYLLNTIGEYIAKDLLKSLKKHRHNTTNLLAFERNTDAKLESLYDSVVRNLVKEKFICDSSTRKYYSKEEVIIANGFDKGLFPNNQLADKQLIYLDDEIVDWLVREFNVQYLSYEKISEEIEKECKIQAKRKNVAFFQSLYNYIIEHENLNLKNKKILITKSWKLVSSDSDIFYGGSSSEFLELPQGISKRINFLHKKIQLPDFREGKNKIGVSEFNTFELVRRMLKLFKIDSVANTDILIALYGIQLTEKSKLEIREKILLPIEGMEEWVSPIYNPIYVDIPELKHLYPQGLFFDFSILSSFKRIDINKFTEFLVDVCGVWMTPGLYVSKEPKAIENGNSRFRLLKSISYLTSSPYYIENDRLLELPIEYNSWFTNAIYRNWSHYINYISSDILPKIKYYTTQSGYRYITDYDQCLKVSQFLNVLKKEKWIRIEGDTSNYHLKELTGIDPLEYLQPHNKSLRKYLKLWPIEYSENRLLINSINLSHLDNPLLENYANILENIGVQFSYMDTPQKEFLNFYNKILRKIFNFYEFLCKDKETAIEKLKNVKFCGSNDLTNSIVWLPANEIFYIDNKLTYDFLPANIKAKLQPQFTNRDKNTFGKIAARIGIKQTDKLHKRLISIHKEPSTNILKYFPEMPSWLALLESINQIVLYSELEKIKECTIVETQSIKSSITVGDSEPVVIMENYFLNLNDNPIIIFIDRAELSNALTADVITEFLTFIVNRDLSNYRPALLAFINTTNKISYLEDYAINYSRINEINESLSTQHLSPFQNFWFAILKTKSLALQEGLLQKEGLNTEEIAVLVSLGKEEISQFNANFDFVNLSYIKNRESLYNLLKGLNISLENLNKHIVPNINFNSFYNSELLRIKNKFEKGFEIFLYKELLNKPLKEQEKYQNLLDSYKFTFRPVIEEEVIFMNVENIFIQTLHAHHSFLQVTNKDLYKIHDISDIKDFFRQNYIELKNKTVNNEIQKEALDVFLGNNSRRSLLYFGNVNYLNSLFQKWFNKNKNKEPEKLDVNEDIDKFTSTKNIIESGITLNIKGKTSQKESVKKGIGRRIDGGSSDKKKESIGLVAEKIVYELLYKDYDQVSWVSKNASKITNHFGYNPEGDDSLGYDIEYLDKNGTKIFIEVKGRADETNAFEISKNELAIASRNKENYKVIMVKNTLLNEKRIIQDLGTIFNFKKGEDFFSNSGFSVDYSNFEISFQLE